VSDAHSKLTKLRTPQLPPFSFLIKRTYHATCTISNEGIAHYVDNGSSLRLSSSMQSMFSGVIRYEKIWSSVKDDRKTSLEALVIAPSRIGSEIILP
jgi:hypothetical protein